MVKQSLDVKLGQHLTLTPALQQSIRMLQLSSLDLQAEIERALDENPMLEAQGAEPEDSDVEPVVQSLQPQATPISQSERYSASRQSRDDDQQELPESSSQPSLREHLFSQLGTTRASERDAALVGLLIDDLNDDGFLVSSLPSIHELLDASLDVELDELQAALGLLQSFDPPGIGARDLAECLSLQLRQPDLKCISALADPKVLELARQICTQHLALLATGNLSKLQDALDCDLDTLQQAHAAILRLNPRPGSAWARPAAQYAIADIVVRKTNHGYEPFLNESALPKLNINAIYAQALGSSRSGEHSALHGQLQEARWLIRNVNQRYETILRVSQFIVAHQQAFFEGGWGRLRPLTLREVAGELGMHESTISRATNQKFMLTPHGTVELKRFFGAGLSSANGQTTSTTAVQTRIRDLIEAEELGKPLSDSQLANLLQKEGVQVARRTVAKYREQMRIPSASLRKSHAQARRS